MAAHADDLRYWYSETIGRSLSVVAAVGASTPISPNPLPPGRYMLRVLDFGGATDLWVRQGPDGNVAAAAVDPSFRLRGHALPEELNKPVLYFMSRPGSKGGSSGGSADDVNQIAIFVVGGTGATVQITKVSRDKQ